MSSDQFDKYLNDYETKYKGVTWAQHLLPKIEKIVQLTLRQMASEAIENRPNSFELYGFDFVLDSKLNPWLIEVNMSPACAERQPWLKDMLDDMSDGVVNLIEAKI